MAVQIARSILNLSSIVILYEIQPHHKVINYHNIVAVNFDYSAAWLPYYEKGVFNGMIANIARC